MRGVPAEPVRASVESELVPAFDPETRFLSWRAKSRDEWSLGLNIDNLIIIDCNDEGVARNIDLLIPDLRWSSTSATQQPQSTQSTRFTIKLPRSVLEEKSVRLPVKVKRGGQVVFVAIGAGPANQGRRVDLSDSSWAWIRDGDLVQLAAVLP